MPQTIEHTAASLNVWLPQIASDAERYKTIPELIENSSEFHLAAIAIGETLAHPSLASAALGPFIRVRIGESAVEAFRFRKEAYDILDPEETVAQPGEIFDLKIRRYVGADVLNPRRVQPVFGQLRYFSLVALGRTLRDGGELSLSE